MISKDANAQDYEFYVLNGENQEGTQIAIDELHDVFGEDIQIHTDPMYAVIAVHTGLGAVGVQFVKKVKGPSHEDCICDGYRNRPASRLLERKRNLLSSITNYL